MEKKLIYHYIPKHIKLIMCGIIAYLSATKNYEMLASIIESLKSLQNRGYDSSGVGLFNNVTREMDVKKITGNNIEELFDMKTKTSHFGIGHNRWSTHGVVNNKNAHPHHSISGKFYIVHNGTIDNFDELKKTIPKYNDQKYSETDTELFINLIEYYYKNNVEEAIQKAISVIEGPFAICVFSILQPDKVYFCRRDLPLLVGFSENLVIASSETVGFYDKVEHYIELKNDDVFPVSVVEEEIQYEKMSKYVKIRVVKSRDVLTPYPFPYWTIKEIMEQPLTVMKSTNMGMRIGSEHEVILRGLNEKRSEILKCNKVMLFGCGTSYHAGSVGAYLLRKMKCFDNCEALIASEFDPDLHIVNNMENTLCIYLSQSGETKDLVDALNIMKETNAVNISIINVVNSLIARTTGCGVYVNASRENGVASTKSFTAQVVVLALISVWINQQRYSEKVIDEKTERTKMVKSLQDLPLDIEACFTLFSKIKNRLCKALTFGKRNSLFILGSGLGYEIAREGALKIKEIAYIHAEAYSLLDLKHGPFALIENGTPIIVIAHDKKSYERSKNICSEIKTRNGLVIFISPYDRIENCDFYIQVPYNQRFSFLLCLIPLQMLAYELTLKFGVNPDFPKNLGLAFALKNLVFSPMLSRKFERKCLLDRHRLRRTIPHRERTESRVMLFPLENRSLRRN